MYHVTKKFTSSNKKTFVLYSDLMNRAKARKNEQLQKGYKDAKAKAAAALDTLQEELDKIEKDGHTIFTNINDWKKDTTGDALIMVDKMLWTATKNALSPVDREPGEILQPRAYAYLLIEHRELISDCETYATIKLMEYANNEKYKNDPFALLAYRAAVHALRKTYNEFIAPAKSERKKDTYTNEKTDEIQNNLIDYHFPAPDRDIIKNDIIDNLSADNIDHAIMDLLTAGKNNTDIAKVLELDRATVYRRINRIRDRLEKYAAAAGVDFNFQNIMHEYNEKEKDLSKGKIFIDELEHIHTGRAGDPALYEFVAYIARNGKTIGNYDYNNMVR